MVICALKDKKGKCAGDSSWLGQVGTVVSEGPSEEVTFIFVLAVSQDMQNPSFRNRD